MMRHFYLLPADFCQEALALYQLAKNDAVAAKQEVMAKYGCVALLRSGRFVQGLAFECSVEPAGFSSPKKNGDYWITRPKRNSRLGKEAQKQLDDCGDLLEIWQWALERALGVYGIVSDRDGFHYLVAKPLSDGRVILDAPAGKNLPKGPQVSRNFDDPVIPECAVRISEAEVQQLLMAYALEPETDV